MAFGFGFNKTKVLAAAERCVQQGKLQNAIAEYEKIAKQDAKDLTVLNTIGDLYARLGNAERAASFFRKVGDAYAADGFTVKAIAMYKKLTKLTPSAVDCVVKLAELYTQQGLYNDARAQYVQIADQHMKAGEFEPASRVFQKMLELDPDNTAMQAKLAELYVRLDKKAEARDILFRAADSLQSRGALDAADDALARVLKIEPGNSRAMLLRGQMALEAGKGAKAIEHLEKVADIDSLPQGLVALLRAYLGAGRLEDIGPVARKLLTVHNDLSGIRSYGDALVAAGQCEQALQVYEEHAERLLAADPAGFGEALRAIIGRVKDNPAALELLRGLYQKAGDTTQIGEVTELLAHALVQTGNLERARDLYHQLAELEPENELHEQNYRQVVARLGEDSVARPLTQEEGGQPLMADELEFTAPALDQEFEPEIAEAVRVAITESELFDSYNLPAKAIAPLETVLGRASEHAQLNQRLASLYARANRFEDAARCCAVLDHLYQKAGHPEEAAQYRAIAARYAQAAAAPPPARVEAPPAIAMPPVASEPFTPRASEFPTAPAAEPAELPVEAATPAFGIEIPAAAAELVPPAAATTPGEFAPVPATKDAGVPEFDLSDEWENEPHVEPLPSSEPVSPPLAETAIAAATEPIGPPVVKEEKEEEVARHPTDVAADLIEETRFYVSQSMWEEAAQAIARCEAVAPQTPELAELKQQVAAAAAKSAPPVFEVVEEAAPVAEPEPPAKPTVAALVFDDAALGLPQPQVQAPAPPPAPAAAVALPTPPAPPAPSAPVIPPTPAVASAPLAAPAAETPTAPVSVEDVLGEFTADLDESLGPDFTLEPGPPPLPDTVAQPPTTVAAQPLTVEGSTAAAAAPAPESPMDEAATSALSDIFAEFKEDLEASGGKTEDTETHYNLGVAYKEMGLLDEAIGELQKVCRAIDHGERFPHVMQAYTWLAQCFVEKGVPEAAIRWYEKALKLPGDDDSGTALHYELACAFEAAGNRQAALAHFMEVYGSNIDYRDVSGRIQSLKS